MSEYLLILKMIASQTPKCEEQEIFPGQIITKKCPVCERVIAMAKLAVQEAEKQERGENDQL